MDTSVPVAGLDLDAVEPGTNVLVSGGAMTGKWETMMSLLAGPGAAERGTVFVTTRRNGASTLRDFQAAAGDVPEDRIAVVDCVSQSGIEEVHAARNRRYVSDPGDLTGIGIGATEFMRQFDEEGLDVRVGMHSLSTMLLYTELKRLFQFLHVLTNRIRGAGFIGVMAIDDTVMDDQEFSVLKQPFDAHIELRETSGMRELRVRGGAFGPREWAPI